MIIPEYDPSDIINKLIKNSNDIDKYNLKFFNEIRKHHIDSVI